MEASSFYRDTPSSEDFAPLPNILDGDCPGQMIPSTLDPKEDEQTVRSSVRPDMAAMRPKVHLIDDLDNQIRSDGEHK